jgi:hypothetical protein
MPVKLITGDDAHRAMGNEQIVDPASPGAALRRMTVTIDVTAIAGTGNPGGLLSRQKQHRPGRLPPKNMLPVRAAGVRELTAWR